MKKVAVIGSGFAGMSAATFLASGGYSVSVFEKNATVGGRARKFEAEGFVYDMGPSWYWMPDVFEKYFNAFGKSVSDYYDLKRLDPSYRVFYSKSDVLDIPAGVEALCTMFDRIEPGSGAQLKKFLSEGEYKYQVGINKLVYKPGLSVGELLDSELIRGVFKLHVFESVSSYVKKYFKDSRLVQLLEFPVLFLGAPASKTPALYTLMNYADMSMGTWYPMGGMHKIVEAMENLAREKGVTFITNANVEKIEVAGDRATSLSANGAQHTFDYVIAG
ncbi:MAG: phytoene desaturase family protein, partial [Flammeovirgaceae bacterium]